MRVLHLTTEFPPVIYGGLGTAVGGLVMASAHAGMSVGVLLIGESSKGGYDRPVPAEHMMPLHVEPVADPGGVAIFHLSWFDAMEASVRLVDEKYSLARTAPQMLDWFQRLIRGDPPRGPATD